MTLTLRSRSTNIHSADSNQELGFWQVTLVASSDDWGWKIEVWHFERGGGLRTSLEVRQFYLGVLFDFTFRRGRHSTRLSAVVQLLLSGFLRGCSWTSYCASVWNQWEIIGHKNDKNGKRVKRRSGEVGSTEQNQTCVCLWLLSFVFLMKRSALHVENGEAKVQHIGLVEKMVQIWEPPPPPLHKPRPVNRWPLTRLSPIKREMS